MLDRLGPRSVGVPMLGRLTIPGRVTVERKAPAEERLRVEPTDGRSAPLERVTRELVLGRCTVGRWRDDEVRGVLDRAGARAADRSTLLR